MTPNMHTIEVDESTAETLRARAAEKGVSVSQLVAELANVENEPVVLDSETIAELDRRWRTAEAKGVTIANEDVVHWLRTWGTPAFKSWRNR